MVVYVAEDGTIIEAIDPSGVEVVLASPELDTLSGTKFVATGETAVQDSAAIPPTDADTPAVATMSTDTGQATLAACCYCQIMGKWYWRLSCC
jgi:hypothetical protein